MLYKKKKIVNILFISQTKMFKLFSLLIFALIFYHVRSCERKEQGVSEEEQQAIVDRHNEIRGLILQGRVPNQPKGKNLKTLKWDERLAASAQDISRRCTFEHVRVKDPRWMVGQNLFESMEPDNDGSDWSLAIKEWYEEYKTYTYSTTTYNHYTQVVWGDTEYIGCGYTSYMGDPGVRNKLYVCNYGPAGNIRGELPYKTAGKGKKRNRNNNNNNN